MRSVWHTMPLEVPVDDEEVWVRRWWFGAPWLATWDEEAGAFASSTGLVLPWYEVSRWRHVIEP